MYILEDGTWCCNGCHLHCELAHHTGRYKSKPALKSNAKSTGTLCIRQVSQRHTALSRVAYQQLLALQLENHCSASEERLYLRLANS